MCQLYDFRAQKASNGAPIGANPPHSGHKNPSIQDNTSQSEFMSLPREVRLLFYPYLFTGKTFSNDTRNLRPSQLDRIHYKDSEARVIPQSLSILLVCRKLNIEATYVLYCKSSCKFILHIDAIGLLDRFSIPPATQRTSIQRLEIVIRLEEYAALSAIAKEKWRAHLENFSLGAGESCKIVLRSSRTHLVSLRFAKGLARLLQMPQGFKLIEMMIVPDTAPCRDGSMYRFGGREYMLVPKAWVTLMKGLEGSLGMATFAREADWDQGVFYSGKSDNSCRLGSCVYTFIKDLG